jgi:predicted TIM-barrel fold metal-dependent hydrolase
LASFPRSIDDPPERDLPANRAPDGVIDAHVHLFPERVFAAIWSWFDENAWIIRYRLLAEQIDSFLGKRGVEHYLALNYSHAPGMAEELNRFTLDFAAAHPRCIPCATVLPGEDDAEGILDRALSAGARTVKLHCHVQRFTPDAPEMDPVYRQVVAHDALLVIHCGSEPTLPGYDFDTRSLTAGALAHALDRYPDLKVSVPHFGFDETADYDAMLDRYEHLYLDVSTMLAEFFDATLPAGILERRWDRLLYGTDFPNLPYAWDRDLRAIEAAGLAPEQQAAILGGNARRLLGLA